MSEGPLTIPVALVSDIDLDAMQITLGLLCSRSKSVTRKKHSTKACSLLSVLQLEADRRNRPRVPSPYRA